MSRVEEKSILVSLDSLMDVRLGAMLLVSEDFALEVSSKKSYYHRTRDDFTTEAMGSLDRATLRKIIEAKPLEVLKRSLYTRMHELLNELITRYQVMASTTPHFNKVSVHVNMYPFALSTEAQHEILHCLNEHLGGSPVPIHAVYLSNQALSVQRIHDDYTAVILYEWIDWLQAQGSKPSAKPLRDVGFYFPRLQHGKDATTEHLAEMKKMGTDPFDILMRVVLQPLMGAQWAPMRYFCATTPENLPRSSMND